MELTHLRPHYSDQIPIQQLVQRRESGSRKKRHTLQTTTPHSTAHRHHKAPPACAMSADTAPGARDVEDDPSAEEALASLEEADALAASDPGIGPSLPPAVSRKRARPPASAAADTRPPIRRHPDGERMHPRNVFAAANPDFAALAATHPRLLPYLVETKDGRRTIDFASWDATVELNRALLDTFYGVKHWDVPRGAACPPAANRANSCMDRGLARALAAGSRRRRPPAPGPPWSASTSASARAASTSAMRRASLNRGRFVARRPDVAVASARASRGGAPRYATSSGGATRGRFALRNVGGAAGRTSTSQTQTQTQTRRRSRARRG